MPVKINLQRSTEVFYSTVNLAGDVPANAMTPSNTWRVEVLAGYAFAQAAGTQDITTLESGLSPDRSSKRFNTSINQVEWNFQAYLRPTGIEAATNTGAGSSTSANVKPVADWFMWQSALNNTAPASGVSERSAWQGGGQYSTASRSAAANVSSHTPNFAIGQENHLYFKVDNVVYQVSNATIESGEIDAAIDSIATTTWTGMGTHLTELTGSSRDMAVAVFGGTTNAGTTTTANSNTVLSAVASYHPWHNWNVNGTVSECAFIKNRLSAIDVWYTNEGGGVNNYIFPVTALSLSIKNNLTYLIPEELARLNRPIGQFAGAREYTGTFSAYLRAGDTESAGFWRNLMNDGRTNHAQSANANLKVGGSTAPFFAAYFPAIQFEIPTHQIEDVVGLTVNFKAQEPLATEGSGGEVIFFSKKT